MSMFDANVTRRRFLETASVTAISATLAPRLFAAPGRSSKAETATQEFYESLSSAQRDKICFPFDHDLRKRISANWHVTELRINDDFYTDSQRGMIDKIVRGLTSEEGYERVVKQTEDDDGGLDFYSVALFGKPSEGNFEFELTGRHLTLRADGNSVDKAAFGGPIVYGHGEEDPNHNLYHYQTTQTNKVFDSLSTDQRKVALLKDAPKEDAVLIRKDKPQFPGISVGELAEDQRQLVSETLKVLMAPYREEDIAEVKEIVKNSGGLKELHMAFYQQGDLNTDKVWDIWRIEGPEFVWHFRGAPHVHAYINIGSAFTA